MKNIPLIIILLLILFNCVGPEEPLDGLSKNSPVVVNTADAFTFSLRAENYTTEEDYTLSFPTLAPIEFTTVIIVTEFAGRSTDTSYFEFFNSNDSLLKRYELKSNIKVAPTESLEPSAIPNKIFFKSDDFSGLVQLTMVISD